MTQRSRYALLGAVLSGGAPLGLLLVRFLESNTTSPAWVRRELTRDPFTYAYVTLSTLLVFALFGRVLGRQLDGLADLANLDPLTGLLNGRAFMERLQQEQERVARYGGQLSLLLIDLDGLKQVNDRHGHAAGTEALLRVGTAIRRIARASDVAARWGGDEFGVLAPQTTGEAARRLGERLRSALAEAAGGAVPVTVSVGVATLDRTADVVSTGSLWERADAALYEAKRQGRDREVLFSSLDRSRTRR